MKCSICLDVIGGDEYKKSKGKLIYCKKKTGCSIKCNHNFHKQCLLNWYYSPKANSDKCPLCREPIIFKRNSLNKNRSLLRKKKIKDYLLEKRDSYLCHNSSELDYYQNSQEHEEEIDDEEIDEDSVFYNIFEQYQIFINSSQNELRNFYNITDPNTLIDENYFLSNMINIYSDTNYPFLINNESLRDELTIEISLQQSLMDTMNLNSLPESLNINHQNSLSDMLETSDNGMDINNMIDHPEAEALPQIMAQQNYQNLVIEDQSINLPNEFREERNDGDDDIDYDELYEEDNLFKGISSEITDELENKLQQNQHIWGVLQMHKHYSRNINKNMRKKFKSKNMFIYKNKKNFIKNNYRKH